jgi:prepilin-type processing-associated H-X9-DG protein
MLVVSNRRPDMAYTTASVLDSPMSAEPVRPPRPGRRGLVWTIGIVVIGGMLISVLLPSLCRSSETANRVKCASNLRQIGAALELYAKAHGGHYPNDLRALLVDGDITSECFVCPSSNDIPATGATPQAVSAGLGEAGHCSYVFYGQGLSTPLDPDRAIVAENLQDHGGVGMNILFGDGHVEFDTKNYAAKLLATVATPAQPTAAGQ